MYGTITEVCRDYANRELIIDSLISKLENLLGLRPTNLTDLNQRYSYTTLHRNDRGTLTRDQSECGWRLEIFSVTS